MSAKPTPGPWSISPKGGAVIATQETGHDDAENKAYYGGSLVCESIHREANARLIAAAPELLAALKGLRHACQHMIGSFDADDIAAFEAASAAIAKATGRDGAE
jgi:hypothetical protein